MTPPSPAWIQVNRGLNAEVVITVTVQSFENPLEIEVDPEEWSRMLSHPNTPVPATVTFKVKP